MHKVSLVTETCDILPECSGTSLVKIAHFYRFLIGGDGMDTSARHHFKITVATSRLTIIDPVASEIARLRHLSVLDANGT
jgi:hypothetical protein